VVQLRAVQEGLSDSVSMTQSRLRKALNLTLSSLAEARRATAILSDQVETNEETAFVLKHVAYQIFWGSGVKMEFSLQEGVPTIPASVHGELIRIGREALTNVFKHAAASTVVISLAFDNNGAELTIIDDGSGFLLSNGSLQRGFGLHMLQARVDRLGGVLEIRSHPGQGTTVTVKVPLPTP